MDTMKLSHLYEKFMVAVEVLATSPASLQRRLDVTEAGCEVIGSVDESKLCLWACALFHHDNTSAKTTKLA
jgi:hypothetical protein